MYDFLGWVMFAMMLVFFGNCYWSRNNENW